MGAMAAGASGGNGGVGGGGGGGVVSMAAAVVPTAVAEDQGQPLVGSLVGLGGDDGSS